MTNRTLYALNPQSGKTLWEFSPRSNSEEWIYSHPSAHAGRVFIGDRCGYFHCLSAKTGKTLWRRLSSRGINNQVNSTAHAVGNRVLTANNKGAVVCYSVETGKTIWHQHIDGPCTCELLRQTTAVIAAAKSLYGLVLQTGEIPFDLKFPKRVVKSVVIAGSRLGVVLVTDFQDQPSAWSRPSTFKGELLILERGVEIARRNLKGTPDLRTCAENGFLIAVDHHGMKVRSVGRIANQV